MLSVFASNGLRVCLTDFFCSRLFFVDRRRVIPELVLGKKIGSGGFCVVQDIIDVRLSKERHNSPQQTNNDQQLLIRFLRDEVAKTCVDRNRRPAASIAREDTPSNKVLAAVAKMVSSPPVVHRKSGTPSSPSHLSYNYVIKMLRHDLPEDEMRKGVMDMAIESNYLQTLSNPNIISLKGMADVEALDSRANFFLIVEKLQCTLDVRLKEWRREVGRAKMGYCCFPFGLLCPDQPRLHLLWEERFVAARDVASAIEYLHSHRIVYRDLKPENIGFDVTKNQVKIFDFGLAKTLPSVEGGSSRSISTGVDGSAGGSVPGMLDQETGMYHLTGNTGSLRYMAPEVALNEPYDQRVDSYSFGILLWQICALSIPYGGYSCKMHADLVVRQGYRPKVYPTWPAHWGKLMRECWAGDVHVRPDFTRIVGVLTQQLDDMQGSSFSPTFKHRKVKAEKVGTGGQALDVDSRLCVQLGDMDMVNISRNSRSDREKGVSKNDGEFVPPESRVV
jgi:serine/threonine protein kinase